MRPSLPFGLSVLACATIASIFAACGEPKPASDNGGASADAGAAVAVPTSFDPSSITPTELALGDSIFHGLKGAASCQACHGPNGDQGTVAPILTDAEWLHSDGSFEGIYNTIKTGVMAPKKFSGVMPPFGGTPLDPASHRAVAAFVYRLGHR